MEKGIRVRAVKTKADRDPEMLDARFPWWVDLDKKKKRERTERGG